MLSLRCFHGCQMGYESVCTFGDCFDEVTLLDPVLYPAAIRVFAREVRMLLSPVLPYLTSPVLFPVFADPPRLPSPIAASKHSCFAPPDDLSL